MPLTIPLTGLTANDPVPGDYFEINFAQGAASLGTATYAAILVGNKSTAGSATVDTVIYGPNSTVPLVTMSDAIALFGQGSELHRQFRRFTTVNPVTPLYAIAVTESVGASATLAVTFTTTATANGTARIWVGDEFVDTAITSGDTAIVIAGNAAAAINSKLDWAVTAANGGTAVCTITAKNKGLRGNFLRGMAAILGTGVGTTVTPTADSAFSGGTTADSNVTALATILPQRFYYVISAAEDAAQYGAVVTQVNSQALPTTGIRQRAFAGSVDTSGNVNTIATGINAARAEVTWLQAATWTPAELAANAAAIYALEEAPLQFKCNFSGYGNDANTVSRWKVPAPRANSGPTRATIKSALNNGVTPIGVNTNGTTYLVKRVTTRSQTGGNADYRIRDAHKVTVCDRFADDALSKFSLQFAGKLLADDPAQGARVPSTVVATPRTIRAALVQLINDYADLDLLQNRDTIVANTIVIREASPTTRASARVPLQTIDILDQIATAVDQVA